MRRGGLAAALLLCGASLARAQAAPPVFSAAAETVNVTVTVRDERGRLVHDLTADDFVLEEEGRPQAIALFGRAAGPGPGTPGSGAEDELALDLGLLMDTSQSMLDVLKFSQEAAIRFLNTIPRARDLLTIFFDQDILISRYDSENQQGLIDRIQSAKGGGMTAFYDAVATYVSRVQEGPGRKVMVVLTDGDDTTSELTFPNLVPLIRSSPVTIYVVAFDGNVQGGRNGPAALRARTALNDMANLTGGEVFRPQTSKDLPQVYARIIDELKAQYVLGFVPDEKTRDGRYRRLEVAVKRKGYKVRHRRGYYAPEAP